MISHVDKPGLAAILHKMANLKARDIDAGMSHLNRSGLFSSNCRFATLILH
jgi:hypothetical protein